MLNSIYASKFYKYSKRKKQINAAMNNPDNNGLVVQLADALDDKYQKPEYLLTEAEKEQIQDQVEEKESGVEEVVDDAGEENVPLEDEPKVSESSNLKKLDKGPKGSEPKNDKPAEPLAPEESATEPKEIKESTEVETKEKEPVLASSTLYFKDYHQLCDQVKGLLNLTNNTCGVSRVLVKEDELQIFYDDSINLNEVMSDVIELLNGAGYTYLDFNRLMRSSNAIVFVINGKDTNNAVKPMNFANEAKS